MHAASLLHLRLSIQSKNLNIEILVIMLLLHIIETGVPLNWKTIILICDGRHKALLSEVRIAWSFHKTHERINESN